MKSSILHSIALYLMVCVLPLMVACSDQGASLLDDKKEAVSLYLNIKPIGLSRSAETLEDNEKMHSVRVIILHPDGTVEHNKFYALSGAQIQNGIVLKLTRDEKKKIFLFANEESVDIVEGIVPGDNSLSDFFDSFSESTPGFEAAVNSLYFAPDYSDGKAIPMSAVYDLDIPEKGDIQRTFHVVRVATKFTIDFRNYRDENVTVNEFSIARHADKNFLMAHVNDTEQNRQLFGEGNTWIDWLKKVSEASSETDAETLGWLKDYELPSAADITKTYVQGEFTVEASSLDSSDPGMWQTVFYLPESKSLKTDIYDGEQEYTLTLKIDGISTPFVCKLPNLKALFRNTHSVINITMFTNEIRFKIDVEPWSFGGRTEIETL